jgi:antitoxin (DNA-binding transcriptional repressor) of toxin-antitoxin stability system
MGTSIRHVGIKQAGKAVARLVGVSLVRKALPTLREFRRALGRDGTPAAQLVRAERDVR